MSTSVVLMVTPKVAVDPGRHVGELPADLRGLLHAVGQPVRHGLVLRGTGPCRFAFQLCGPDRLLTGRRLEQQARALGYDVELAVSP